MEKITKREMYEAIAEAAKTGTACKYDAADVIAFCENEISLLDKKADKAKERAATKAKEGDALTALVLEALTEDYQPIADIAAVVATKDADATVSKVTYRLTSLVKNGAAEKTELTIAGGEGVKSRKIQGYRIVNA
jgi:hypothetical protein